MAFGLPVISFDNHGPREILNNNEYGILIKRNDIKEFGIKLNDLIKNPTKREFFQKKSLERVEDFKMEKIIKEWEAIISDI